MTADSRTGVKTYWKATLIGPDGEVKFDGPIIPNTLSKYGIDAMHLAILSPSSRPAVFQYIAIGTNNTAESRDHSALLGEVHRMAATETDHETDTILTTLRASFGPGEGVGTIYEAGLFNASSGGTMLARSLLTVTGKGALDTLNIEVQFKLDEVEDL